jgi:hypothetical protein
MLPGKWFGDLVQSYGISSDKRDMSGLGLPDSMENSSDIGQNEVR